MTSWKLAYHGNQVLVKPVKTALQRLLGFLTPDHPASTDCCLVTASFTKNATVLYIEEP